MLPLLRNGWKRLGRFLGGRSPDEPTAKLSIRETYRLWSETYDAQPDNVVLALEGQLFERLLPERLAGQGRVADVGCGTGRHWERLMALHPRTLQGVDASPEMLARLHTRHPAADLRRRDGAALPLEPRSVDLLVSTLMLGHVPDPGAELREWARVLSTDACVVLTDFHPEALRRGARRTFRHARATYEAEAYAHPLETLEAIFASLGWRVLGREETSNAVEVPGARPAAERTRSEMPLLFGFLLQTTR